MSSYCRVVFQHFVSSRGNKYVSPLFVFQVHADAEESVDEDLIGSPEALNLARVDDNEREEVSASQKPCGSDEASQRIVVCRDEAGAQEASTVSTQGAPTAPDPIEPGDAPFSVSEDVDFSSGVVSTAPAGLVADSSEEASNQDGSISEPPTIP